MTILGMMSGTSLDGLDLALCEFRELATAEKYEYKIIAATTVAYPGEWCEKLKNAPRLSGRELTELDRNFAGYCAGEVNKFLKTTPVQPDAVASHGHTVFHRPSEGYTLQIGSGAVLAAHTGITTVCDFRSGDVALGGQGAPLVPAGDRLLFSEYDACLNLGGIANASFADGSALDICFFNMELNMHALRAGKPYDAGGEMASRGRVLPDLKKELDSFDFFKQQGPKSLGFEDFENHRLPLWNRYATTSPEDALATVAAHAAEQLHAALAGKAKRVLVTGGGAFNSFILEKMRALAGNQFEYAIPDRETVEFKEALIFAFLGFLRLSGRDNCLASVTGARRNSCGGAVYAGANNA